MTVICLLLQLYVIAFFARIILSWFPLDPGGPMAAVFRVLHAITEPLLAPIRKILPPVRLGTMGLDLSPIVVLIGIQVFIGIICR